MTLTASKPRDLRHILRAGLGGVRLDGRVIPLVFYADGRRKVVRAFKQDPETGRPYLEQPAIPGWLEIAKVELRGRRLEWLHRGDGSR